MGKDLHHTYFSISYTYHDYNSTSVEGIKSIYKSFVVYRSNSPVWNETMKIR